MEESTPRSVEGSADELSGSDTEYDLPDIHDVIERLEDVTTLSSADNVVSTDTDRSIDCSYPQVSESSLSAASSYGGNLSSQPSPESTIVVGHNQLSSDSVHETSFDTTRTKLVTIESESTSNKVADTPKDIPLYNFERRLKSTSSSGTSVKRLLKRLTGKSIEDSTESNEDKRTGAKPIRLPQLFVVKYLGKRDCDGLRGVKFVRKPVDAMVQQVTEQLSETVKSVELPLVYTIVTHKGVDIRPHKNNKIDICSLTRIPIDFISYGLQDVKFPRIFTFIVVQEMSCRSKKLECHALLCDTPQSARMLALSLGAAFRVYMKQLQAQGKTHRFQVELRSPEEISKNEEEC